MRIAIVGAGAIGVWFGTRLARAGYEVSVLARGDTLRAIARHGLRLIVRGETLSATARVHDNPVELGVQDLVIIALKGPVLLGVAPTVSKLLGPDTCVLSAMNGIPWWFFHGMPGSMADTKLLSVDPGAAISTAIPPPRVLGCVVHASCSTLHPGCSVHINGNSLILGDPRGGASTRLDAVVATLRRAGYDVTVSQKVQQAIWYKLWGNMTMNPISGLTGATGDRILDDPLINDFILRVMAEASEIGRHIGCPITETGEDRNNVTRKLGAFKTSMLQDVEAGRPLEINALLAAPREIGRNVGVATPNIDALLGLTRLFAAVKGLNPLEPPQ
jgi:2-dehydropantoate 2-reductase